MHGAHTHLKWPLLLPAGLVLPASVPSTEQRTGGSKDAVATKPALRHCSARTMREATATRLVLPTWDVFLIQENAGQIRRASWLRGCLGRKLGIGLGGRGIKWSDDLQG